MKEKKEPENKKRAGRQVYMNFHTQRNRSTTPGQCNAHTEKEIRSSKSDEKHLNHNKIKARLLNIYFHIRNKKENERHQTTAIPNPTRKACRSSQTELDTN